MKILQITPQAPSNKSGGGIGVLQTTLSLVKNRYDVYYVGPDIEEKEIAELYQQTYFLKNNSNIFRRLWNLTKGITNSRYDAWKHLDIDYNMFDVIVIDFTKLDYVLQKLCKKNIIVRVHNVEYDYANNDYKKNGGLEKKILALLSKKQEQAILSRATRLFVLTGHDKDRIEELYGANLQKKMQICPVCVKREKIDIKEKGSCLNLLITGSMWYGDNANGALWFINKVFAKLEFPKKLTIAGSKPNHEIKEAAIKYSDIEVIDSPKDLSQYFKQTDVVVTPVFEGAGMKVKVAEALSYGKPVVGTTHAFIGYDVSHGIDSFIADTVAEFKQCLESIYEKNNAEWMQICKLARTLYEEKYSIEFSANIWKRNIENIMEGKNDNNQDTI